MLAAGRTTWTVGERVRVYRATRGRSCLFVEPDEDDAGAPPDEADDALAPADLADPGAPAAPAPPAMATAPPVAPPGDPRDYDVDHYLRVLRDTYAARLARALTPEDFAAIFADPEQPSLFARPLRDARPILTPIVQPEPELDDDAPAPHALHR